MLKANELRIGNWVMIYGSPQKIHSIDENSINGDFYGDGSANYLDGCSPISLTPEILEKAGFKRKGNTKNWFNLKINKLQKITACNVSPNETWACFTVNNYYGGEAVFYLHDLQNLYFALTGNELEINLNPSLQR